MAKNLKASEEELLEEIASAEAKRNQIDAKARNDADTLFQDIRVYLLQHRADANIVTMGEDGKTVRIKVGKKVFKVTANGDDYAIPHDNVDKAGMQEAVLKYLYEGFAERQSATSPLPDRATN